MDFQEEEDFVSVRSSNYYKKNLNETMIDYSIYHEKDWVKIEETSINDLPFLDNHCITDYLDQFCEEYDSYTMEELLTSASGIVPSFTQYICNVTIGKLAHTIAQYWPPSISRDHYTIPSFVVLLAKVLHRLKEPSKFLYFIRNRLYILLWTQRPSFVNPELLSMCSCSYKGKSTCWAYIDRERMFYVYQSKNDTCVPLIKCQITNCVVNKQKQTIIIQDINRRNFCEIKPNDLDQIALWDILYSKKKVPYPFFFTSANETFPDIAYPALIAMVTANDSFIVHCLMHGDFHDPQLWEGLVKIYAYVEKLNMLVEAVFMETFHENFHFNTNSFDEDAYFLLLARAVGKLYFKDYFENFFKWIAQIIDYHDDLELSDITLVDVKLCEKVFFNVLSYTLTSASFIPYEWRLCMNILRCYLNSRYNSKSLTMLGLSQFFGRGIICSFFRENIAFYEQMSVGHPDNFPVFAYLLTIPFSLNIFSGPTEGFSSWNKRLEKHFYPRYYKFLMNISDYEGKHVPRYPDERQLGYACYIVMKALYEGNITNTVTECIEPYARFNSGPTLPGWNLTCLLNNLFVHKYDPHVIVVKKKEKVIPAPVKLPFLPVYQPNGNDIGKRPKFKGSARQGMGSASDAIFVNQNASRKQIQDQNKDEMVVDRDVDFFIPQRKAEPGVFNIDNKMKLPEVSLPVVHDPIDYGMDYFNEDEGLVTDDEPHTLLSREVDGKAINTVPKNFKAIKDPNAYESNALPKKNYSPVGQKFSVPSKPTLTNRSTPRKQTMESDDMRDFLKTIDNDDESDHKAKSPKRKVFVHYDQANSPNPPKKLYKKVPKSAK